jgi:hypothetical protein
MRVKNVEELDIKQLMFIEDIKQRYKLKKFKLCRDFFNAIIIISDDFKNFHISYGTRNVSNYSIYMESGVTLKFIKYEDFIEVIDIINNSFNIYYKNFPVREGGPLDKKTDYTDCIIEGKYNIVIITHKGKSIMFEIKMINGCGILEKL